MTHKCLCCAQPLSGKQKKFCSGKCRSIYHRYNPNENRKPQSRIFQETCEICDKPLSGRQRRFCSVDCKNAYHQMYSRQYMRGLARKLELVHLLGGECMRCGYNKNLAALSFHHVDEKNHTLDMRSLSNRTMSAVLEEFEKCILLCSNCHMENIIQISTWRR
jgi:hypothetical protein